jgi:hypothetical protein
MARPLYTPPPASGPPTVGDPDFAAKADAYLGWFPTHGTFSDNLATWFQTEFFGELADGTAALPAVRFKNDGNTGLYRAGADQLSFSEGGVDRGRIYGRKNIVGSVAQSGGTPTGAIIERGSNANGEFVRLADGMQFCALTLNITDITTASGSIFTSSGETGWTFPAAFASATNLAVLCGLRASGAAWAKGRAASTAAAQLRLFSSTSAGGSYTVEALAVGRWF